MQFFMCVVVQVDYTTTLFEFEFENFWTGNFFKCYIIIVLNNTTYR